MTLHCKACSEFAKESNKTCICEYLLKLEGAFKDIDKTGRGALTYKEFHAAIKKGNQIGLDFLDAFEIEIPGTKKIFEETIADESMHEKLDQAMKPITAEQLVMGITRMKGPPRRALWTVPAIKKPRNLRAPSDREVTQWSLRKDLVEYPVGQMMTHDDPDWLKHNEGFPEYDNPYKPPKALEAETLRRWRPETLRQAPLKEKLSQTGSSTRFGEITCEAAGSATMAATVDSWTNRTFSDRTIAAFGGSRDWSRTVKPKLTPLQTTKHCSSSPLLPVQAKRLPNEMQRGALRSVWSLVWKTSDEAFLEQFGPGKDPADALFQRSVTKFGYRNHGDAAASLDQAARADPRYPQVFRQRSVMQLEANDFDAVIANCTEALRLDGTHAPTWGMRADAKLLKGDFKGAKADCDQAICRDARIPRIWNTRSFANFKLGDLEGSIEDADQAVRLDPTVADFWSGRAAGKVRVEDWEGALEDSSEAVRLDHHSVSAWVSRAAARNGLEQYEGALADSNQAIRLDSICCPALVHRGYAKIFLGDFNGAVADCNRAIAINPKYPPAWCTRGEGKFHVGDTDEAIKDFDQTLRADDTHARAWYYRGKCFLAKGKYAAARVDCAQAFHLDPRIEDARRIVGVCDVHEKTNSAWKMPVFERGLVNMFVEYEQTRRQDRSLRPEFLLRSKLVNA